LNKRTETGKKKSGGRFSTSLVVGLLLVPISAVAAVALVNPDAAAETEDVAAVEIIAETTTTTEAAAEIVIPEIASAEDLALACGDEGWSLVTKEVDGTISPLEQAALDSLRAICLAEGMELPGPPAPESVVQTITVVAAPPPTTTDTDTGTGTDSVDSAAAEFEADYAATVAYINKAIDNGAGGEKIAKAELKVGEAATLADGGDYASGRDKLAEARKLADEADRRSHDDDDDEDEEDDDHEDEEDDDHEEDDDDDD
jgi:hypothetical protein